MTVNMLKHLVLSLAVAALAVGCARGPNVTSEQLPLRRVVVYRNGVGYFERSGEVDSDEVTFRMKKQMVGDFLASLAIVERGGSSVRSASFPLEIDDDEPPPEPLPGLQSRLKRLPPPPPPKKDDDMREVVLRLDGKEHDLVIGYVAETPLWRPSYRLVVNEKGQADLQAWGIVQNLSGEDWNDVELALVAGAPIAFESTLGDPIIPRRPIVTDTGEVIVSVPEAVTSLQDEQSKDADGVADTEDVDTAEEGYGYSYEADAANRGAGAPSAAAPPPPTAPPAPGSAPMK
jgi:hypothetical protein